MTLSTQTISHYRLIASNGRRDNLARVREPLHVPSGVDDAVSAKDAKTVSAQPTYICPHSGGPMIIIETFGRNQPIRALPRLRGVA
jgi:hypothetical protein